MTKVTVDADLRAKLLNLTTPLLLCDENGVVVAELKPKFNPADYEPLEPQITMEEAARRLASDAKRYTTAEVLAYLEKL